METVDSKGDWKEVGGVASAVEVFGLTSLLGRVMAMGSVANGKHGVSKLSCGKNSVPLKMMVG